MPANTATKMPVFYIILEIIAIKMPAITATKMPAITASKIPAFLKMSLNARICFIEFSYLNLLKIFINF